MQDAITDRHLQETNARNGYRIVKPRSTELDLPRIDGMDCAEAQAE